MTNIFLSCFSAFTYLSWFYVLSILISVTAVLTAAAFKLPFYSTKRNTHDPVKDESEVQQRGIQARYKYVRQRIMESSLTPQQLEDEKNVEVQTLTTIMEILQKRSDLFSAATMDDLEEQLNLYRRSYNA